MAYKFGVQTILRGNNENIHGHVKVKLLDFKVYNKRNNLSPNTDTFFQRKKKNKKKVIKKKKGKKANKKERERK